MNYTVIHTGDSKEAYWTKAFEEYQKRMNAFGHLRAIALKPARLSEDPSPSEIEKALEKEADAVEEQLRKNALDGANTLRIALCIEGKLLSSQQLSALFSDAALSGKSNVVFLIGSSHGLSSRLKKDAFRLSFSPMTFPHQLAKVMLAEQIYRAEMILRGSKYHK